MKDGAPQVDYAVRVLQIAQDRNNSGVSARDLVADLGVSKSTIQRVLVSLEAGDLLTCGQDGKYRLSHRVLALADAFYRSSDFRGVVVPIMRRLESDIHETVVLSVESNRSRVTIAQVESPHELRYRTDLGRSYPLWGGASGWLLAYAAGPEGVEHACQTFAQELDRQGIDLTEREARVENLRAEIELSGTRGWAVSKGTWAPGGFGISVPLEMKVDGSNAALTVYGPEARLTPDRHEGIREALLATAREIDSALAIRQ